MLKCKNSRASRNYELLLGFRPGSLLFLRVRLFRCLLFGGGFLFRFQFCFCFCFFLGSQSGSWRSRPGWFFGSGFGPRFSRRLDHRLGGIFLPGARVVRRLVVVAKEIVFSAHSHLLVQEAAPSSGLFVRDIIPLLYGSAMRERQYSFLFRGNRPSTPFAGNTAQDFARSCRKLDLSELVFGTFLADLLNRGPRSGRRTCGRVFRFGHIPTIFEDSRLSCGTPSDSYGNGYIATSASDSARRERLYCRSHHCHH